MSVDHPKAVIFTHFGRLRREDLFDPGRRSLYAGILRSYLQCERISVVYIYVDYAFQREVGTITVEKDSFRIRAKTLQQDMELKEWLERLVDDERTRMKGAGSTPTIQIITLEALLGLLDNLIQVDPALLGLLHGPEKQFTYDSPKFVEAVIRLARGDTPHLAHLPVIRIDEDAILTSRALDTLIDTYVRLKNDHRFFFFSGTYGNRRRTRVDWINDFAVRTAHFVDEGTSDGTKLKAKTEDMIRTFLADLNAIGATQLDDSPSYYSEALREILERTPGRKPERKRQVISGAGLTMASRTVRFLPPFMNLEHLTTWVDDHLKRRLHEAVRDLHQSIIECEATIAITQHRHPENVKRRDKNWHVTRYFDRLLRGCMFRRLISDPITEDPTKYSELIAEIIRHRVVRDPRPKAGHVQFGGSPSKRKILRDKLKRQAGERYDEVLECWTSVELAGSDLHEWANARRNPSRNDSLRVCDVLDWEGFMKMVKDRDRDADKQLRRLLSRKTPKSNEELAGLLNQIMETHDFEPGVSKVRLKRGKRRNRRILEDNYLEIALANHRERTIDAVVGDAMRYGDLVLQWPTFVRAIERLDAHHARWLYA